MHMYTGSCFRRILLSLSTQIHICADKHTYICCTYRQPASHASLPTDTGIAVNAPRSLCTQIYIFIYIHPYRDSGSFTQLHSSFLLHTHAHTPCMYKHTYMYTYIYIEYKVCII